MEEMKCPKCGSTRWILLTTTNFNVQVVKDMRCNECDYEGTMAEFSGEEKAPGSGGGGGGMSAAFEVNDLDIYTDAPVLKYAEAKDLPVVKELERRARAWCTATQMQYDPAHIIVAQLPTGNVSILTKLGKLKQKGRRRVRGPGSRWMPKYVTQFENITWIEKRIGTEYDADKNQIRLIDKSRFVATIPELIVSEKEL